MDEADIERARNKEVHPGEEAIRAELSEHIKPERVSHVMDNPIPSEQGVSLNELGKTDPVHALELARLMFRWNSVDGNA